MTREIEIFYDFPSPYSYLAFSQLRGMDVSMTLRPMDILAVMDKVGNTPTTLTCSAKGRYAGTDLRRWCDRYGLSLHPSDMHANDCAAMARAVLASPDQAFEATIALYRAIWGEGRTLATADAVVSELTGAGIDTTGLAERMESAGVLARLAANTEEAAARGVFGSPTIFVGEEMFFGNDRLDFVREELTRVEEMA